MKSKTKYKGAYIRANGKRVANLDPRIPSSFEQYSIKSGETTKVYLVCKKMINAMSKCEYSVRKDLFIDNKEKHLNHTCVSQQIDKYFTQKKNDQEINETSDTPTIALIKFIGECMLPINIINSPSFKDFQVSLVKTGQSNPETDAESLTVSISRTTLTNKFIKYSQRCFEQKLSSFKAKGTCLAIDAGKHKSIPYLIAVIVNCLISESPLMVDCHRFFDGKQHEYVKVVEEIVRSLMQVGIEIVAIISDNLKSQTSAVNYRSPLSMQQNTTDPKISKVLWVGCACHTLALGLYDASQQCDYGRLVKHVRDSAKFLRTKNIVNLLGIKCPIDSPTRWTGICDICFWMMNNLETISTKIKESLSKEKAYEIPSYIIDGFTNAAAILLKILLPFRIATHKLEADNMPAAYIAPIINCAIAKMEELCNDVNNEIITTITECINKRMKASQSGMMYQFLFSLTPLGRQEIRNWDGIEAKNGDTVEPTEDFSFNFSEKEDKILSNLCNEEESFPKQQCNLLMKLYDEYKGTLINVFNSKKVIEHNGELSSDEEEDIQLSHPENSVINFMENPKNADPEDDEEDISSEYCSSSDESSDSDSEEISEDEINEKSNGPLEDNISVLKEIASLQGYTPQEIMNIVTQYGSWLLDDPKEFIIHDEFLSKKHKCWNYFKGFPQMELLSKFALPLMGITSSEASCERAFWKHRKVIGDAGMKTNPDLEKAKMFFAFK